MNCFQHTQKAAVGHCTYCGRGLCQECATVVDGKLSCRGSCQQEIARERRLIANSESSLNQRSVVFETSSGVYQRSFAFSAIFGLSMLALGAVLVLKQVPIFGAVMAAMGIVFLINSVGMARASKRFKTLAAEGRDEGTRP